MTNKPATTTELLPFRSRVNDLLADDDLEYDSWASMGAQLDELEANGPWMAVDWLLYGTNNYPEAQLASSQIFRRMGAAKRAKYRFCGTVFPPSRRRPELTYSHHEALMYINEALQEELLDFAVEHELSVKDTAAELRARKVDDTNPLDGMSQSAQEEAINRARLYQRAHDIADSARMNNASNLSVPKSVFLAVMEKCPKPDMPEAAIIETTSKKAIGK